MRLNLQIDLDRLADNYRQLRKNTPDTVDIMPVVKANAYGHGLLDVSKRLSQLGAPVLAVATLQEAKILDGAGLDSRLFLLSEACESEWDNGLLSSLIYTVYSRAYIERLNDFALSHSKTILLHLKIDTGMHRLGCSPDEALDLAKTIVDLPGLKLDGVMTHFSDSETVDSVSVSRQMSVFKVSLETLKAEDMLPKTIHASNSGAIRNYSIDSVTLLRPGMMLYEGVMQVDSVVSRIYAVAKGECIGYGDTYRFESDTSVGMVPVGYADGISSLLSNRGEVLINGRRYPIVGRVCMDMVMVDLGLDLVVDVNDTVTFLGKNGHEIISFYDIAKASGLNPREVTCLMGHRYSLR